MSKDLGQDRRVTQAQLERLADWSMRKPVIALMGEFSSGKSTLLNLLIGQDILPTQVTATRMPPVWLTYGNEAPYRMDDQGRKHRVNLQKTDNIPIKSTRYIRLFVEADILKQCDLIDTPGISDPNIKTSYWLRTVRFANAVMWCTHAGQAWRESERGAWEALPPRLRETSILLVTRKDKVRSGRDLEKIRRRLERETQHLFNSRMFVSLTNAIRARQAGDAAAWAESGAEEFAEMIEKIVEGIYIQRSYMLARYVTDDQDSAAKHEALSDLAPGLTSGNLLGFEGKSQPVPDHDATTETSVFNDTVEETVRDEAQVASDAMERLAVLLETDQAEAPDQPQDPEPSPENNLLEEALKEMAPKTPSGTLDIGSYRLADPTAYRTDRERRVALSNYRLKDPSQHDELVTPEDAARAAVLEEVGQIKDIFEKMSAQYDLSKTPHLTAAIQQLISDLEQEAELQRQT